MAVEEKGRGNDELYDIEPLWNFTRPRGQNSRAATFFTLYE